MCTVSLFGIKNMYVYEVKTSDIRIYADCLPLVVGNPVIRSTEIPCRGRVATEERSRPTVCCLFSGLLCNSTGIAVSLLLFESFFRVLCKIFCFENVVQAFVGRVAVLVV